MKKRLSKTLERLKGEKLIDPDSESKVNKLTSYEIKIFRLLREKYDLSLSIEKEEKSKGNEAELTLEAKATLERINKGDSFKI
mgnify:CR=1 FL=1